MKHTKTIVFSLSGVMALAVIGVASGIILADKGQAKNQIFEDEVVADDIGGAIKFADGDGTAITINSVIGVQAIDGKDGETSLRYVVALSGYRGISSASFTRTVTAADGTVVKEAKSFNISCVYSSVVNSDTIKWTTALDTAAYPYYAVYTLNNIPEDHQLDSVRVDFSATMGETPVGTVAQTANVRGVKGEEAVGVSFAQTSDDVTNGTWYAVCTSKAITEAVVPSRHYGIDEGSLVATDLGPVTCIGKSTGYDGGFEGCSYLTKVTLPSTIKTFNKYCFSGCKLLTELTLPESLTDILTSAFSNMNSLAVVNYKAKAITSVGDSFDSVSNIVVNVASSVESLPNGRLFDAKYLPSRINYEGTEAQWATLIADKTNGLNIDNVFCSDTTVVTATFHIGEGSVTVAGESKTGDLVKSVISGKLLADIGKPKLAGQMFAGWFTSADGTDLFDFTAPITANVELFAHYTPFPAGNSLDDPFVVTDASYNGTITTVEGMETVFFKFVAPATDLYYVNLGEPTLDAEASTTTSTSYTKIHVFDSAKAEVTPASVAIGSTEKIMEKDDDFIYANLAAGDTYYFSFILYESSYSPDNHAYGEAPVSIYTKEHDTVDTAIAYAFGETVAVPYVEDDPATIYSFTAATTGTFAFNVMNTGSLYFSFYLYDGNDFSKNIGDVHGTSTVLKLVSLTAGDTYYVSASSNSDTTADKTMSFSISEPPAGSTAANPNTSLVVGADATNIVNTGGNSTYYKLTVADAGIYRIMLTGGTTYTAKNIDVLDSTGTSVGSLTEAGKVVSDGYGGETTDYGTNIELDVTLAAGDYVIKAGYVSTYTPEAIKIQVKIGTPGFSADNPIAIDNVTDGTVLTFDGAAGNLAALTADNIHYSFTATEAKFYVFTLATELTGVKASILDSATGHAVKASLSGNKLQFKATAETSYIIQIGGAVGTATLTLAFADSIQDGTSFDTAFVFAGDATTGLMSVTPPTSANFDPCYYKVSIAAAGKYRFWSTNNGSMDTWLRGVYAASDKTTSLGHVDDGGSGHTDYCEYRYDYYLEIDLAAAGDYYFSVKIPYGTYTLSLGVSLVA